MVYAGIQEKPPWLNKDNGRNRRCCRTVAVIAAYLIGSIPTAYIVTRLVNGKDIRKIGGGNVGARNVFVEVNKAAGIGVGLFDVAKGAGVVILAEWLLGWPLPFVVGPGLFVLGAAIAAVVGHIWSVYLKFTGGNGLATCLGVLVLLMTRELLLALAIALLLAVFTHNLILSLNISPSFGARISAGSLGRHWQRLAAGRLPPCSSGHNDRPLFSLTLWLISPDPGAREVLCEFLRRKKTEK